MGKCTTCGGSGKIRFKTNGGGRSNPTNCHTCLGTGKTQDLISNADVYNNRKEMFNTAQKQRNERYLN